MAPNISSFRTFFEQCTSNFPFVTYRVYPKKVALKYPAVMSIQKEFTKSNTTLERSGPELPVSMYPLLSKRAIFDVFSSGDDVIDIYFALHQAYNMYG